MLGLFGGKFAGSELGLGLELRGGRGKQRWREEEEARGESRCGLIVLVGGLRVCLEEV